ncbi:MAG TPA: calcium-binding protein, partial [Allosphingosinicella sp.]
GDGTYATAEGRKTLVGVERVLVVGSGHDDRMSGGSDNDSLNGGQGNDMLKGGAGDDTLTGEAGADSLYGEDGDDTFLDSPLHGGPADRLLDGGAGIDRAQIYLPDHTADIVFSIRNPARNANFGSTVVRNVEQVLLWAGSGDDHLTGGRLDDDLFSSAGDDTLLGLGGRDDLYSGEGDDILSGGGGNDRLFGDAGRDRLSGGSGNDDLEGGDDHDLLIGGAGGDRMDGGYGNDSYFVDSVSDEVVETAVDGGVDIVFASLSFTLGEGVEHLRLEGSEGLTGLGNAADNDVEGTSGADTLYGQGGRDRIIGNDGDDRLDGGSGNDQLRGGAGSDQFVFTEILSAEDNVDALADFNVADDVILLWGRVFAGIGVGRLGSDAFHYGAEAADAEDRILYQQWTGRLFYDPDGSGRAEPILFARVEAGLELTAADFAVQS